MNKLQHLQYLNFRKPSRYADNITAIQSKPSLDLNFARNKSLIDNVTGNNLVTFTRASSGTFVNSNGVLQSAPVNFIRNNTMVGAVAGTPGTAPTNWTATAATNLSREVIGTGVENGINYIDLRFTGTVTAARTQYIFFEPISQIAAINGQSWAGSVWLKLAGGSLANITSVAIQADTRDSAFVYVNTPYNSTISLTSALTRFAASGLATGASVAWVQPFVQFTTTASGSIDITLRIGLPQLEQGSSATEIIRTTGTINSAPRFDHNPTTGESLGLLVEEQRTNEVRNSNNMSAVVTGSPGTLPSGWSSQSNSNGWTREVVGSGSIGAMNYVDIKLSGTPTISTLVVVFQGQNIVSASNGQTWAASVYHQLVAGSRDNIIGYPAANLWSSGGAYLGSLSVPGTIQPSSVLQRYTGSATIGNASTAFISWGITFVCTIGQTYDFTIRFALPQLEQGAFATSVIPTTGTAATRSADLASITGTNFSSWYNQTEGTIFCDAKEYPFASGVSRTFYGLDASSAPNTDYIRQWIWSGASGSLLNSVYTSASGPVAAEFTQLLTNEQKRVATAVKVNDFARSYNGNAAVVDTAGNMPVGIDRLGVGSTNNSLFMSGHIRRITYFPQRLSNANLQRITQ